jgi:hypothetical protein
MSVRLKVGDSVYHKDDALKRIGVVVEMFNWLGQRKLVVNSPNGDRLWKDFEHAFASPVDGERYNLDQRQP